MSKGQQTGLAATYLVAAELVLYGYNAVVTSRNMQGTDILVENPATGRSVAMQVKANRATFTDFLVGKARLSREDSTSSSISVGKPMGTRRSTT